jgi:hypothetical protein
MFFLTPIYFSYFLILDRRYFSLSVRGVVSKQLLEDPINFLIVFQTVKTNDTNK